MMYEKDSRYSEPKSVAEVVELLYSDLTVDDIATLAQLEDEEFYEFYSKVASSILDEFNIWEGNDALLQSCLDKMDNDESNLDPALIIMKAVRTRVQQESGVVILLP